MQGWIENNVDIDASRSSFGLNGTKYLLYFRVPYPRGAVYVYNSHCQFLSHSYRNHYNRTCKKKLGLHHKYYTNNKVDSLFGVRDFQTPVFTI